VKWINEFGYVTIPTLALTAFVLLVAFLLLGALEVDSYREIDAQTSVTEGSDRRR
jgi:hypothetical protein